MRWRPASLRDFLTECPQATPEQMYLYNQAFQAWIVNDFEQAVGIYRAMLYDFPESTILQECLTKAQEAYDGY